MLSTIFFLLPRQIRKTENIEMSSIYSLTHFSNACNTRCDPCQSQDPRTQFKLPIGIIWNQTLDPSAVASKVYKVAGSEVE